MINLHSDAVNMALTKFPGAKLTAIGNPLFCQHCDRRIIPQYHRAYDSGSSVRELVAILDQRRGKIVERAWPGGRRQSACHFCGREVTAPMIRESPEREKPSAQIEYSNKKMAGRR